MSNGEMTDVESLDPSASFALLSEEAGAQLVDVRTKAEWTFVGTPALDDLGKSIWTIEWQSFPSMAVNDSFTEALSTMVAEHARSGGAPTTALLFLCRSGQRSHSAALAAGAHPAFASMRLINVVEGFEGPPDAQGRRGRAQGWKARDLPWRQS